MRRRKRVGRGGEGREALKARGCRGGQQEYWMLEVAGIPRLVQIVIMMPALRKFLRGVRGGG